MKPKPTEAQIEKLGRLWLDHLYYYRNIDITMYGDRMFREKVRSLISHNIAYVYEQQFDVKVEFLCPPGSAVPYAVSVNGKVFEQKYETPGKREKSEQHWITLRDQLKNELESKNIGHPASNAEKLPLPKE